MLACPSISVVGKLRDLLVDDKDSIIIAHYDEGSVLVGQQYIKGSNIEHIDFPLRQIVFDAISFGATSIFLAHNHLRV
jgi:DNA repair protein RadC